MSSTNESQHRVVDGVQVPGVPTKIGPFKHYQSFSVEVSDGKTMEFYTDKIYRVRTAGKIGYANLKMIFVNEKTSKCFARFVLFHLPEDTKCGNQIWKHGQDELLKYSHSVTIRCSRAPTWTIPVKEEENEGTRSFKNIDFEEHKRGTYSLVRLRQDSKRDCLGQYSVFAGNAKLAKETGFDVTNAEFIPIVDSVGKAESTSKPQTQPKLQTQPEPEPKGEPLPEPMSEQKPTQTEISGSGMIRIKSNCLEMTDKSDQGEKKNNDDKKVTSTIIERHEKTKGEMKNKLNAVETTASTRAKRSCKSVYGSCRKRLLDEKESSFQQSSAKRMKIDEKQVKAVSRKRKREEDSFEAVSNMLEGERDCKVKVLSYDQYTAFRKCEMGLRSGLIMKKEDAVAKGVIATDGQSYRIFFTRASFSDKSLLQSQIFERKIERKCQFGKKRKVKSEAIASAKPESPFSEADCFKEDNWKEISEDLYFQSTGYLRASERLNAEDSGRRSIGKVQKG